MSKIYDKKCLLSLVDISGHKKGNEQKYLGNLSFVVVFILYSQDAFICACNLNTVRCFERNPMQNPFKSITCINTPKGWDTVPRTPISN